VSLHDKKGLNKIDKKGWCYDKFFVNLKEFGPELNTLVDPQMISFAP